MKTHACLGLILLVSWSLLGCSKSDSAGSVLAGTSYYIEVSDLNDGSGGGLHLIIYTDNTFDIYQTKYLENYFHKVSGTINGTTATITSRSCANSPATTISTIVASGSSATINWVDNSNSNPGSGILVTTKPATFEDFSTSTQYCLTATYF